MNYMICINHTFILLRNYTTKER